MKKKIVRTCIKTKKCDSSASAFVKQLKQQTSKDKWRRRRDTMSKEKQI